MTGRTRPRFEHAAWGVVIMIVVSSWCTGMPILEERSRRDLIGDNVQRYLMDFGYLPQSDLETGNLRSHEQLRDAIKTLQTFGNIPATGELDETTRELMKKPRCGLPDIASNHFRSKRYTLHGQKWHYTNLTWSLRTMYIPGLDPNMVRGVLYRALDVWAQHSKLTFQEINDDRADILVFFERRYHGDGYPFDGPGQILAHAFFPGSGRGGDAHFDLEENWLLHHPLDSSEGTSLFAVAAHEFGHSLGLSHSSVPGALMFPWYQGIKPNFQLPDDDRHGIQQLYGVKERQWAEIPEYPPRPRPTHRPHHEHTPPAPPTQPPPPRPSPTRPRAPPQAPTTTTTTPRTYPAYPEQPVKPTKKPHRKKPGKPDTCDTSYDAISVIRGETFIFKGRYFWRIGNKGLVPGYPVETDRMWYNLPKNFTHVDAVYERSDKKIVFFIGKSYYLYSGNLLESGYPKPLSDLGLPESLDKVDGAMIWSHNGKTYFFSGTMYWKFDEEVGKVELDYPRDMSMWNGVGYNIDAVFQWKDGKTYFFKGKGFWKFNDLRMRVENERQTLSAPFWMGCPRELESRNEKTLEAPLNEEPSMELPPESGSASVNISLLTLLISAVSWLA